VFDFAARPRGRVIRSGPSYISPTTEIDSHAALRSNTLVVCAEIIVSPTRSNGSGYLMGSSLWSYRRLRGWPHSRFGVQGSNMVSTSTYRNPPAHERADLPCMLLSPESNVITRKSGVPSASGDFSRATLVRGTDRAGNEPLAPSQSPTRSAPSRHWRAYCSLTPHARVLQELVVMISEERRIPYGRHAHAGRRMTNSLCVMVWRRMCWS